MSRPYKECVLFDSVYVDGDNGNNNFGRLIVKNNYKVSLKQNAVTILWRGSIDKFKKDFEIPDDAPLSTKETNLPNGGNGQFVYNWDWTTINFKFNYHIWYRNAASTSYNYVFGSNNTIDITIPNVMVFNGSKQYNTPIITPENVYYNPNLFRLPVGINTFAASNKVSDFTAAAPSGSDRDIYLMFRYGVDGDDIQICLLTRDINGMNYNSFPLIMAYASLTFKGFNKIKRLQRDL